MSIYITEKWLLALFNKNICVKDCTNGRGERNLCSKKAHLLSSTKHLLDLQSKHSPTFRRLHRKKKQKNKSRQMHLHQGWIQPLLCMSISLCDDKRKLTCPRDENSYFNFVPSGLVLTLYNNIIQQVLGAAELQSFKKILDFDVRTSSRYVRKTKVKYFRSYFPIYI